ncbi:putative HTH-type transcriptional regulator TtgW [Roseovarius albus]|uniref:Putative HTH-type transcriptional regulator TtgW n=1 Tax=Roseovarius albus TaxID=1247867 RepID=A0A1X6ZJD2_9RHOB|nr:TetR/AcrR family transcriptional regulator [Roseovarius albus]SLN52850.1 putative HTH-type transcriptional regulator TtgW [Roseovarius albus]
MPLLSTSQNTARQPRLTGADWVEAALHVLIGNGIEAVQITALARQLDVTRGSFYWHFESRENLLDALLEEWRARNTGVMLEAIRETSCLEDGIFSLFSVWVDHTRFDPKLDQAIRDWARHSDKLREILKIEDNARVSAIAGFYERHGFPEAEAFIRARVIYFTQISFYALKVEDDEDFQERLGYLNEYFKCFTGRDMDPALGAAHTAKFLKGISDE